MNRRTMLGSCLGFLGALVGMPLVGNVEGIVGVDPPMDIWSRNSTLFKNPPRLIVVPGVERVRVDLQSVEKLRPKLMAQFGEEWWGEVIDMRRTARGIQVAFVPGSIKKHALS